MPPTSRVNARSTLAVTTAALFVTALLPPGWGISRRISWLQEPVYTLVSPVQAPMGAAVRWITNRNREGPAEGSPAAEHAARVAELELALLNEREQSENLRRVIADLQRGLALNAQVPRQVFAPIIGGSADLSSGIVTAKAGAREGVTVGAVAVAGGVNLVGRVTKVERLVSLILPITQRASGSISGVVMVGEMEKGPICELRPKGDGTLVGAVGTRSSPGVEVREGMTVRLADQDWPTSSQMLILGNVESVETDPTGHLRVVVRPRMRFDRLTDTWLRLTGAGVEEGGVP